MIVVAVLVFMLLLVLGVPVAFAIGVAGLAGLAILAGEKRRSMACAPPLRASRYVT